MQKRSFLILVLLLSLFKVYAKEKLPNIPQSSPLKIGYTNVEYILGLLPEAKMIASEYASFEKQLNNQLIAKIEAFQKQADAFEQGKEVMTEAARNQKKIELQQLEGSIRQFQLELQEKSDNKRNDLLRPIYDKIINAIQQVAKENGYTHVLNTNVGNMPVLLYADEAHNISDWVLKNLGIDPDATKVNNSKK
jgi:outer membrane protein